MEELDLNNLPVFPIRDYHYEDSFKKIKPNGQVMNVMERRELIQMIDSRVALNNKFLSLILNSQKESEGKTNEYYTILRVILNACMFTAQTTADCMVACKYFLLADTGYDRRYMRGKLKVILNEGIKRLVGFRPEKQKESIWGTITEIRDHFCGPLYQQQYERLDALLKKHASQSSWWKDERDAETHLDPWKLYYSRQKDIDESTVMIESLELIGALDAVDHFLNNLHAGMTNWLNELYRQHPEKFVNE